MKIDEHVVWLVVAVAMFFLLISMVWTTHIEAMREYEMADRMPVGRVEQYKSRW
jgi:hypothetical protein